MVGEEWKGRGRAGGAGREGGNRQSTRKGRTENKTKKIELACESNATNGGKGFLL